MYLYERALRALMGLWERARNMAGRIVDVEKGKRAIVENRDNVEICAQGLSSTDQVAQ